MALIKYTDTYCTLAEAAASMALIRNQMWPKLSTAEKEALLTTASFYLDNFQWRGEKVDSAQAMKFPREIASHGEWVADDFTTAEQGRRLAEAVSAQITAILSPVQAEAIKIGVQTDRISLLPAAEKFVMLYMIWNSPLGREYDVLYGQDLNGIWYPQPAYSPGVGRPYP